MLAVGSYPGLLGICNLCSLLELERTQACGVKVSVARVRGTDWNTKTLSEG